MGWPTGTDLENYLQAAGLVSDPLTDAQELFDFDGAIEAAIAQWNDETHYWPFLSTGLPTVRVFNAPYGRLLDLNGGLLSLEWLSIDVAATNSYGTRQTNLSDFTLQPSDAPSRGRPYTYIEFEGWQGGDNRSIEVYGIWGFTLDANLSAKAKRGVLAMAALDLLPQILTLQSRGGLTELQEGDSRKKWDTKSATDFFGSDVKRALAGYVRHRVAGGALR